MKRIFTAITLMVYFLVSTGFSVSVHYCMDEFDSAQIGVKDDNSCNRCGMDVGDNNCCRDEVKVHKLETSHLASYAVQLQVPSPALMEIPTAFVAEDFNSHNKAHYFVSHSPPLSGQDLLIRHCVFRI